MLMGPVISSGVFISRAKPSIRSVTKQKDRVCDPSPKMVMSFAEQGLADEVGDDTPIVRAHIRTIGIEDPGDLDLQLMLPMIIEEQSFSATLAFIIAGANSNRD